MITCVLLQMEGKSYRSLPLRMMCVAAASRPFAKSFSFGEAVTAAMTTLHQCVLSDGNALHLMTLPEGREDVMVVNQTYIFKNLVVKESRAYFNDNTACFKSYPMTIRPELMDQASRMLLPPSPPIKIKDARDTDQTYFTVEGQVKSVSNCLSVLGKSGQRGAHLKIGC